MSTNRLAAVLYVASGVMLLLGAVFAPIFIGACVENRHYIPALQPYEVGLFAAVALFVGGVAGETLLRPRLVTAMRRGR